MTEATFECDFGIGGNNGYDNAFRNMSNRSGSVALGGTYRKVSGMFGRAVKIPMTDHPRALKQLEKILEMAL